MKGKIQSVTESPTTFTVTIENDPPPGTTDILNPPEWSRPLFRAGIGKSVDITENPPGTVGSVKVSA